MKKRIWIIILVIALAAAGFFAYRSFQAARVAASSSFQTEKLARGDLTSMIGATGIVRANQTAVLSWQTTGTVGSVHVSVNDTVSADQVLAELVKNSLPQNIILAQAELVTAEKNLDNLVNSDTASAQAEQTLVNARKNLEDAQKKLDSKSYTRASQDVIDTAYANYILAQNEVDRLQGIYDGTAHLAEEDLNRASALSALAAAKQRRDTALANYNYAKDRPDEIDVSIAQANVDLAKANLADAEREWNRLKDGPDPNDIAAAQARVNAIRATLELAAIMAPFDGVITAVYAKAGDQAAPGATAFRVDDLTHMLVDVQVTEVDINQIRPGQPVTFSFDAIPAKEYTGSVTEVGRVGTETQGVVNFNVTIELNDADERVLPGMTAAVNIVVEQLEDVLLVPNRAVRQREGQLTVYVLRNSLPEQVDIEVGASSDVYSELVSGDIQEGEEIVMNPGVMLDMGSGGGAMMGPPGSRNP